LSNTEAVKSVTLEWKNSEEQHSQQTGVHAQLSLVMWKMFQAFNKTCKGVNPPLISGELQYT